jgi:signal transduction histidine kinase
LDSAGKITPMAITGDHFRFNTRPIHYHNYLYPIKLKPKEKATFLLWADKRGQNMVMPLGLAKDVHLIHSEIPFYTFFGIFVGIYLFAIVFNILLFISIRDKIHLYYALYVCCILVFNLEDEGLAFQWIYPDIPMLQDYLRYIIAFLSSALLVQIMQLFVNQTRENSKLYHLANAYKFICCLLTLIPISLFFKESFVLEKVNFFATNFMSLITVFILIACAIERIIKGYKLAWYYLIAMFILLFGILNYVFNTLGITSFYLFPMTTGLVVGLTAEIVFLAFALTQRYNFLKGEKKILLKQKAELEVALIDDVFAAQENERARLARDLHDDLGGTLSAIKLNLTAFKANVNNLSEKNQLFYGKTIHMIEKACSNLREIAHDLMPKNLEQLGLIDALNEQFINLKQSSTIDFEFVYDIQKTIIPELALANYRIIKELINNIEKHSCATRASVQLLSSTDQITIMCEDNGIGFDIAKDQMGLGLNNITSRVNYLKGTIYIDSNNNGTTITIKIPH